MPRGLRALALASLAMLGGSGCSTLAVREVTPNPLVVPSADYDAVWKQTVAVVDEYFDGLKENRLAGTIVTDPKVGATLLEPWHGDSIGFHDRVESTLQTIRRYAIVEVRPAPGGGYVVKVEVKKQLEDMVKPDRALGGSRAVFNNDFPVNRARDIVGPVPVPIGWIDRGRDTKVEQAILSRLRKALFL